MVNGVLEILTLKKKREETKIKIRRYANTHAHRIGCQKKRGVKRVPRERERERDGSIHSSAPEKVFIDSPPSETGGLLYYTYMYKYITPRQQQSKTEANEQRSIYTIQKDLSAIDESMRITRR